MSPANIGGPAVCIDPGSCPVDMSQRPDMAHAPQDFAVPNGPDGSQPPPPPGPMCGQQTYSVAITRSAPNIHLVIDRSGSMWYTPEGGDPTASGAPASKWVALGNTLNDLLDNHGSEANEWGMSLFPTSSTYHSCQAGGIAVALGAPNTVIPQIKSQIAAYSQSTILSDNGYTPTTAAIQGVVDNVNLADGTRNNYVVLMTDGLPNCAGNPEAGVTPLIASLYSQSPSVRTFVIGFGSDTVPNPVASQATNPALLSDWAVAGHTDLPGSTKYYQASDAASLAQAFSDIVTGVAACTYSLTSTPNDPSLVAAYFDGVAVPNDPFLGFTYDQGTNSVTFHGLSCATIQNTSSLNVQVVYGCPPTM